jgi:hypothetical protein
MISTVTKGSDFPLRSAAIRLRASNIRIVRSPITVCLYFRMWWECGDCGACSEVIACGVVYGGECIALNIACVGGVRVWCSCVVLVCGVRVWCSCVVRVWVVLVCGVGLRVCVCVIVC